jgi:integrase
MASLSEQGGRWMVQFLAAGERRATVRLGRCGKKAAGKAKVMIELLADAKAAGSAPDAAAAAWLEGIGGRLRDRLASFGLVAARGREGLAAFADRCLDAVPVGEGTRVNMGQTKRLLVQYFGADRVVNEVTAAEADAWAASLRKGYADASVGRHVKRARQFWRLAVRWGLAGGNPFEGVPAPSQANPERSAFVPREWVERMMAACTNWRWRAVIALSRFGGLRVPSEAALLTWDDVAWDRGRFWATSPKTQRHEGKAGRWVPLFPELVPHLREAELEATGPAVLRGVGGASNLRTNLGKIIKRAGLEPWPRLFHNMRASRETELAADYPLHVVCAWIGHSPAIAAKHYLQVRESDFDRATGCAANALHGGRQPGGSEGFGRSETARHLKITPAAVTPTGIASRGDSKGKTPCLPESAAFSELDELWRRLTPAARGQVLDLARSLARRAAA